MPQAIGDPDELERFANNLQKFTDDLQVRLTSLQSQFNNLGETWRDQEHSKFAQEFQQTTLVLRRFMETAKEHVPFLRRKARSLRGYFHQG